MTHFKARNLTALLLVLVLLVSMFSTTALAAEDEYITDFEAESEIIIEEEPTEELPEAEESSEEVPEIEESSEVSDAPTSGTIPGSNIQWELTDDGMLLISGSGGCAAFSSAADQPWAAVREQITSVFFEDPSLLSIYDLAFWFDGCVSLTTAEIPYTTPVIGTRAFYGCVSLTTIMTYYGDSVLAEIGADAFYLPYDSGSTLYIGYLIGYPESTVPLHTYDWTGSNRSSLYFMDVYSTNALTSVVGACPSCGKQSLQGTYVAQSHTSRGHAEYYECYLCHYTKYLGSYVYKNHGSGSYGSWTCPSCGSHSWVLDYESDATCTRNGYREYSCDCGQSKRETVYATGHNYSYGSWEQFSSSQHRRENYCRYCGSTDYDYASHSYSYGSWSSAGSSQHSRSMTCRYCGYSDTQYASHSLSYEHVFLLTKSRSYYYDALAIAEPMAPTSIARYKRGRIGGKYAEEVPGQNKVQGLNQTRSGGYYEDGAAPTVRNKRDVWQINPFPYKGSHFAAFPPKLVETCLLAGCPQDGIVLDPFLGSGTTAAVAKQMGRHYIGIELNPDYCALAEQRIGGVTE